jgi:prolyl 4-hydroxylase
MEKLLENWVNQTNWNENIASALATFCKLKNLEISKKTIFQNYIGGETMADFSEISRFCNDWGIDCMPLDFVKKHLDNQFLPIFVLMDGYRTVLVIKVELDVVYFFDGVKGLIEESTTSFFERSMGHIVLVEVENYKKESYFEKHEKEEAQRLKKISDKFSLKIIDNFLTSEECDKLREKGESQYIRSEVRASDNSKDSKVSEARTSSSAFLTQKDLLFDTLRERAAKLINVNKERFESIQLTSYSKGQLYEAHSDAFTDKDLEALKDGQRTNTVLVYLNDDFEGGGTYFPFLSKIVKAKKGRAVTWESLDDKGEIDPIGTHGGLPVMNGRKYISNLWVRDRNQKNWE